MRTNRNDPKDANAPVQKGNYVTETHPEVVTALINAKAYLETDAETRKYDVNGVGAYTDILKALEKLGVK